MHLVCSFSQLKERFGETMQWIDKIHRKSDSMIRLQSELVDLTEVWLILHTLQCDSHHLSVLVFTWYFVLHATHALTGGCLLQDISSESDRSIVKFLHLIRRLHSWGCTASVTHACAAETTSRGSLIRESLPFHLQP